MAQSIIILAGGDRTGKSTLSDYFEKKGYKYKHFGPPTSDPYKEYDNFFENVLKDSADNWIVDRYIYCEYVYSKYYKRSSNCTIEKIKQLESKLKTCNTTIIYCENDLEKNLELIKQEGKNELKTKEDVLFIREKYRECLSQSTLPVYIYDFTKGDTPESIHKKVAK